MLLRSDTLSWFLANQSLVFLINDVCLTENEAIHINFIACWLDRTWLEHTTILELNPNNYTTCAVYVKKKKKHYYIDAFFKVTNVSFNYRVHSEQFTFLSWIVYCNSGFKEINSELYWYISSNCLPWLDIYHINTHTCVL